MLPFLGDICPSSGKQNTSLGHQTQYQLTQMIN